jgi:hypothetical protein
MSGILDLVIGSLMILTLALAYLRRTDGDGK